MATTTTTITRTTKRPFYFRCTECGALNAAMYPIQVSSSYDDNNAGFRRQTREQNMKMRDDEARNRLDLAMQGKLYTVTTEPLRTGWMGTTDAPGVCGKCSAKQAWNQPVAGWFPMFLLCVGGFLGAVILFGTRHGGSYLPTLIALVLGIAGVVGMKMANKAHLKKVDAVPEANRPHVFATPESFLEAFARERKDDEPIYGELAKDPALAK